MKKLQDVNKNLKDTVVELSAENIGLTRKFSKLKELVIEYEANRVKHFNEAEEIIKQLTLENISLRKVLTIGKENYAEVAERLKQQEQVEDEEMPIEVQQMMLDRMDEVQATREGQIPHSEEDETYNTVFKNKDLGSTLNGSQMARLKRMFEDSGLEGELQGSSIKDDLDELYDNELADSDNYGQQPTQEEIQKMMMQIQEHQDDELERDEREAVDE